MKSTHFITSIFLLLLLSANLLADDGVSINEDGTPPHESAILDVQSENKGFLPPRMTSADREAINNPAEGLTIFNTDTDCINFYNGSSWREVCEE